MNQLVRNVLSEIDRLATFIPSAELRVQDVSDWSVGQHIEHVAKATSAFAVTLLRNQGTPTVSNESPLKKALLTRGSIPRGVAQAPDITLPGNDPDRKALNTLLLKTRKRVDRLEGLLPQAAAEHHYLGTMQRDEALAFLAIHLRHHISIIEDIVKAAG